MTMIAVTCPECRRGFTVSGRSRCRCGAYLVHHFDGGSMFIPEGSVWYWRGDGWDRSPTALSQGAKSE